MEDKPIPAMEMSQPKIFCSVLFVTDFVASVERETLQARRCREATPERDARVGLVAKYFI